MNPAGKALTITRRRPKSKSRPARLKRGKSKPVQMVARAPYYGSKIKA